MPPAARSLRAICTYATEKMVRMIVAKKKAAGAYFSFPAPTTNGKLNMNTANGAEPVTQRKRIEEKADRAGSQLLDALVVADVDRGDGPLVDHVRMGCTAPTLRVARH